MQFSWKISAITGAYEYRYTVTLTDERPDLSHLGISIQCPDTGHLLIDALLADLHFVPDIGHGLLKWDDLPDGNAPGQWDFWVVTDRAPVEGYAVLKAGPHHITYETHVPGCHIIPEPTSFLLILTGLLALITRRRR